MFKTMSPDAETLNEANWALKPKQMQVALLVAQGYSVEAACRETVISMRTYYRWRKQENFSNALAELKKQFIDQYERTFTSMLPEVAQRHRKLIKSDNEMVAMRAVDSAHANHARCVREIETKSEVEELRELVLKLTDQLAKQRNE